MPVLMIAGLGSLVLGIVLFFAWSEQILALIMAVLPLVFIIGGAVASYLGWEEMKEGRSPAMDFSSPDEANRYKAEAKAYQAELNEMRSDPDKVIEAESAPVEPAGASEPPEPAPQTGEAAASQDDNAENK